MNNPVSSDFERAVQLFNLGSIDAAEGLCESALRRDRRSPHLRHLLGVIRLNQGKIEQSVDILKKLARDIPANGAVLTDLALALDRAGRSDQAEEQLRRVTRIDRAAPLPWLILGSIQEAQGRPADALASYLEARNRAPDSVDVHVAVGNAQLASSDSTGAIESFRKAAVLGPGRPELLVNLGNALKHAGRVVEAEQQYADALALDPDHVLALYNRGVLLFETDRALESLAYLERAVSIDPAFLPAHYNLGLLFADVDNYARALHHLGIVVAKDPGNLDAAIVHAECLGLAEDRATAETSLREILRQHPQSSLAFKAMAKVLAAGQRWSEAAEALRHALTQTPDDVESLLGLYKANCRLGDEAAADAAFDRAYAIDSKQARACFARQALASGNLDLARHHFEQIVRREIDAEAWRADIGNIDLLQGRFTSSAWDALRRLLTVARNDKASGPHQLPADERLAADLDGKRVLVRGEQGIGDELFFMRWLAGLRHRGARVHYLVHTPKLYPLLRRQDLQLDGIFAPGEAVPDVDVSVWVNELPAVLADPARENALAAPPPALPLHADAVRVARWREKLAALGPPPYVGVTWSAGATFTGVDLVRQGLKNLSKKISPQDLGSALTSLPGTYLALQRNPAAADMDALAAALGRPLHDLSAMNDDLDEAVALLATLDTYVAVSNTNMHLLAGLGGAAHVLVPWLPEWRWLSAGDASPWFPDFRVYRQTPTGDWQLALERLSRNLRALHQAGVEDAGASAPVADSQASAQGSDDASALRVPRALAEAPAVAPRTPPPARPLISEAYRQMQEKLHENPNYGTASVEFAATVGNFIVAHGIRELLDYGAGKGRLGQELRKLVSAPLAIHHYEPSVAQWALPPDAREFVACIDVLEHIEPELLDNVLDDLQRLVLRFGMFTIATGPANKVLPDGRNAHLIQEPPSWWLPKLLERFELVHFNRFPRGFLVVVEPHKPQRP